MTIRTLILAPSKEDLIQLSRELSARDAALQVTNVEGGITELYTMVMRDEVDLVVADVPFVSDENLGMLESVLAARPRVTVILVTRETSSEFLLRAMRAGVREVVLPSALGGGLAEAFNRQVERVGVIRNPRRVGRVIAFMPAKGGSGATFLATNLAYALASRGKKVAVLDLNLQFGDVALFVSERRPTANIADVSREAHRLDLALLESSMMHVATNLWVLAAPNSPERSVEVKPDVVERIIALARNRFDFVLLDVGRILESVSIKALDEAETIYLVLQAALPTLNDARRLITVLTGLGYGRDKVKLVLNRVDKRGDIGIAEVAKTLGSDIAVQIPNSYLNVVHSINHGIPILKHAPKDPVVDALEQWADQLAPRPEKQSGWLRGLFAAKS